MTTTQKDYGYCDGDACNRHGCEGHIERRASENCSCHISPPCSACTAPRGYCDTCDWEEINEEHINDFIVQVDPKTRVIKSYERRPLDTSKIDWHSMSHTHFSMIKEGVYPDGTTRQEVLAAVVGTFGGTFEHFGNGKFKYIAYTD
jgi:hypothetical protein